MFSRVFYVASCILNKYQSCSSNARSSEIGKAIEIALQLCGIDKRHYYILWWKGVEMSGSGCSLFHSWIKNISTIYVGVDCFVIIAEINIWHYCMVYLFTTSINSTGIAVLCCCLIFWARIILNCMYNIHKNAGRQRRKHRRWLDSSVTHTHARTHANTHVHVLGHATLVILNFSSGNS